MPPGRGPEFDPAAVFPTDDCRNVLLVRFLVASQSLAAIARLPRLLPDGYALEESRLFLMVLSVGAANEAALAFQQADKAGAFQELDKTKWVEPKEPLARLRVDANHKADDSLRSKIIRTTRNTLGFHWDPAVIKGSLEALGGHMVPAWLGDGGEAVADNAIPLVSVVILDALKRGAGSKEELDRLIAEVARFQGDCFHVAHAAFTLALRRSGVGAGAV